MIESARRERFLCAIMQARAIAAISSEGQREREKTERSCPQTGKTEKVRQVERRRRRGGSGRNKKREKERNGHRGEGLVRCEALAASIQPGTCHVKFSGSGRVCVRPMFSDRPRRQERAVGRKGTRIYGR